MSFFDVIRNKNNISSTSLADSTVKNTMQSVNRLFQQNPNYRIVKINNQDVEVIIDSGKLTDEKRLLFKPTQEIFIGDTLTIEEVSYLILEKFIDVNEIYPTAKIKECNSTLKVKGQVEKVQIGVDPVFGTPVYDEVVTSDIEIPCVVENKIFQSNSDEAINLPNNQLVITIPYTVHEDIDYDKKFQMFGEEYKITGFDKTIKGLLKIYGKRVGIDVE